MIIRRLSRGMSQQFHRNELVESRLRKQIKFWAFDSEFLMSGRASAPEDVHTVQFSDGESSYVLESAEALKRWLYEHRTLRTLYGFVILPDMGSLEEWSVPVKIWSRGTQHIGQIKLGAANVYVYDARSLFSTFGLRKLEDVGKAVGVLKLPKPEWLGLRKWETEVEHEDFKLYAAQDAIITSLGVKWLWDKCRADPMLHASAGTLAKDEFKLPNRLKRIKKRVTLPPLEQLVKNSTFAGRSEGFITGFTPNVAYNDVKSLYPVSIVASRTLQIIGAESCNPKDLVISRNLNETRFGWIEGSFRTNNDLWGLPLRAQNNIYVTGTVQGFYHTFDLAAAKAEILNVAHAYKPIFSKMQRRIHDKFADYCLRRVEKRLNIDESMLAKAILNALSGKLGQSHPIARTSNFYAYSTLLAYSHLIMSWLFNKCDIPIIAMDTDSIFMQRDLSGKYADLTDGNVSLPLIMEVKGKGDLAFFRSKSYILKGAEIVYGRHAWRYWTEDYLKLWSGDIESLTTRQDIKHTLLTRQREALKMAKGRWRTQPVTLDLLKIKELLKADLKRRREDYDSYKLVQLRKNVTSVSWRYEDILAAQNNLLGYPKEF